MKALGSFNTKVIWSLIPVIVIILIHLGIRTQIIKNWVCDFKKLCLIITSIFHFVNFRRQFNSLLFVIPSVSLGSVYLRSLVAAIGFLNKPHSIGDLNITFFGWNFCFPFRNPIVVIYENIELLVSVSVIGFSFITMLPICNWLIF